MTDSIPPLSLVAGLPERFWSFVEAGDCWLWLGSADRKGYAWEILVGPIPDGLDLDHRCYVESCVNPDHLEPVTRAENLRRRRFGKCEQRTHCPKGHPYSAENTMLTSKGHRQCRECAKEWWKRPRRDEPEPCTALGCDRPINYRRLCNMHIQRLVRAEM